MGKIGSYDYPETQIKTLIDAVEIIVNKFNGQLNSDKTLAEALGHSTPTSGGFIVKISDLRKYGFLEKRGLIATSRSKKIAQPLSPDERQIAISKAISEISLWMAIYERTKSKQPNSEDFKLHLKDITDDRDSVVKKGDKILNLYKDAMNYFIDGNANKNSNLSKEYDNMNNLQRPQELPVSESTSEGMLLLKVGKQSVNLEKNDSNIQILMNILEGMKSNPHQGKVKEKAIN